jgi:hypothetical protein
MGDALIYSLEGARRERFKAASNHVHCNDGDIRFSTISWGSSCRSRWGTIYLEKIICESD